MTEQTPSLFDALQGSGHGAYGHEYARCLIKSNAKEKEKTKNESKRCAKGIKQEEANKLIDKDEAISR